MVKQNNDSKKSLKTNYEGEKSKIVYSDLPTVS